MFTKNIRNVLVLIKMWTSGWHRTLMQIVETSHTVIKYCSLCSSAETAFAKDESARRPINRNRQLFESF